jgi:site-specific DNA recombinase
MKQNGTTTKYFLYARKSSESEDRQVASIDSQIENMKQDAEREHLAIIDVLSEAQSAKAPGRPVFSRMIERIRRGEAQGVICWKLDRLARNPVDGGQVSWMLQQGLITHIRTHERDYYSTDNVLMMSVEFGMANQYVRDLSASVKRGLTDKAKRGWYPVQPPLGYLNDRTPAKGQRTIMKDPERFAVVRKIFDHMLAGAYTAPRVLQIATNQWALRTRRGRKLSESNIYDLLGNPFYYGMFEFPRGSGLWYRGAHEPMITPEEYDGIQVLLGRKGRPRSKGHNFAFTGTMQCVECGAAVTAEEKFKYPKNGKIHHYIYYHCTKRKKPDCTEPSLEEKGLLSQITEIVDRFMIPPEFQAYALKWFRNEHEKETESQKAVFASRHQAYNACVQKLDKLIDMRAAEEITEDEFVRKRAEVVKEKARYQGVLNDSADGSPRVAEDMLTFIRDVKDRLDHGTPEQRREILLALGSNHQLGSRKLALELQKPLIPMGKAASEVREIHRRFEPRKNRMTQRDFEAIYARTPVVSALLEQVRTSLRSLSGYSPFKIVARWCHYLEESAQA